MSALDELKNINFPSDLDCAVIFYGDDDSEEAQTDAEAAANELLDLRAELADKAAELLALRERVAKLEESIKAAQVELHATQRNWDEECLFKCNDILTSALKIQ